ncbi:DUF1269 domain-containing protein [Nocardia huaxiensis]|uniref:DUF1269 domain-containing protein n=1 Tax=Nocardia huaxiensis TaxID=2755382 RepID=A0A7D6ZG83_9NOCA|nr:DUF1269 domain-containing protein [Nocardia huaxiensis]QLY32998.1 DUF1269 domain-containing protein [Nocardia huaxiensis]UFS93241.1 DUF1269 domain-containing protein [Nocardia huaxiensis]
MAGTLTVWKFPTPDGAEIAVETLEELAKEQLISVHDAAIVSWPEGAKKPKTKQLRKLTGIGALGGAFWGLLFGLIFFIPLLGLAIGAGLGAMTGAMRDVGIDDEFINRLRAEITEGTSALFVLTSDAVPDRVLERFPGQEAQLLATNLSQAQEEMLREIFSA